MEPHAERHGASERAHLDRSLGRIGTKLADATPLALVGTLIPHPRVAAAMRRCRDAATNELFTDIEMAPERGPTVSVPRLRLCLEA